MKNFRFIPAVLLGSAAACGCSKDLPNANNPSVQNLPEMPFSITIRENIRGCHPDSLYTLLPEPDKLTGELSYSRGEGPDGREFGFERQCGPLTVTPENDIVLISSAEVNASSETDAIDVERLDGDCRTAYRLVFRHEGESRIRFWNGSNNTFSIHALARSAIALEGIRIIIDGQVFSLPCQHGYSLDRDFRVTRLPFRFPENSVEDPLLGCAMELQCIPFNASGEGNVLEICYDFGQLTSSPDGGGIHSWNIANYPSFRWFDPNGSTTVPPSFYQRLYPSDLLGRRIWVWNSSASLEIAFKKSGEPLFWAGSLQTYLFPF